MLHTCLVIPNLKWFKIQIPGNLELMCSKLCQEAGGKRTTLDYSTLGNLFIDDDHSYYFSSWIEEFKILGAYF